MGILSDVGGALGSAAGAVGGAVGSAASTVGYEFSLNPQTNAFNFANPVLAHPCRAHFLDEDEQADDDAETRPSP